MARESKGRLVGGAVLVVFLLGFLILLQPPGLSSGAKRAAALALFAIVFWALDSLPGYLTAFVFFLLAVLLGVSPDVVFAGFQSGGLWLAFSGFVIGIAIRRTGLAARLAHGMVGIFGYSYRGLVGGLVCVGFVLMFVMASGIGRVLLVVPLAQALSKRVGLAPGSTGESGFVMAAAAGTLLPAAAVLPANLPNVLLMGAAGTLYDLTMHYGSYLLLHLPVTGTLKAVTVAITTLYVFPATPHRDPEVEPTSPLTRSEWVLTAVLLLTLCLWLSDTWHGIKPAWIGLGAAVFCLLPPVGLMPEDAFEQVKFSALIYMAGIIGLGALVASSGLGGVLGHLVLNITNVEAGHDVYNFVALSMMPTTLGLFTTVPGVPAVLTPMAAELAHAAGWPVLTVVMTQVLGYSTILFPYQAPALVLAMERSQVRLADVLRFLLMLALWTLLVLTPLNYVWWHLLGYF
jgi:anion transporter